ncbi:hypothetical protein A9Q89_07245 [Gammaproteobacteria bacterium 53_120_T64]|nr:hypothetical protein A9Q89_07245 [Gammaproteobacteria bacterium 53_120_T64]
MRLEHVNTDAGELVVTFFGELDALGCTHIRPELEAIVASKDSQRVTLNLREVSFIDSSGIGAIVYLYKRLKSQGRILDISGARGQALELIELLRIDTVITLKSNAARLKNTGASHV